MHWQCVRYADAWRTPLLGVDKRTIQASRAVHAIRQARQLFVDEAQKAMAPPG